MIIDHIEIHPMICNGRPVIAGTRIPVTVILDQFAAGANIDEIQQKYPELTRELIMAAIRYCHAVIESSELEAAMA